MILNEDGIEIVQPLKGKSIFTGLVKKVSWVIKKITLWSFIDENFGNIPNFINKIISWDFTPEKINYFIRYNISNNEIRGIFDYLVTHCHQNKEDNFHLNYLKTWLLEKFTPETEEDYNNILLFMPINNKDYYRNKWLNINSRTIYLIFAVTTTEINKILKKFERSDKIKLIDELELIENMDSENLNTYNMQHIRSLINK